MNEVECLKEDFELMRTMARKWVQRIQEVKALPDNPLNSEEAAQLRSNVIVVVVSLHNLLEPDKWGTAFKNLVQNLEDGE
jgi:hypothetical protein